MRPESRIGLSALLLSLLCSISPPAAAEVDLWPLLEISDSATTVVYPFWVRERQHAYISRVDELGVEIQLRAQPDDGVETIKPGASFAGHSFADLAAMGVGPVDTPDFIMAFPWYYRTNHGRDHHVLWPLYKRSEGATERVAPFWFRGENRYTLLPIVHRTPSYTIWMPLLTYVEHDGPGLAVLPFFWRTEHKLFALPAYYRNRTPGEPANDLLFPLWGWERDDRQQTVWALAGLYARIRGPGEASEDLLFPFWYRGRSGDTVTTGILFPFYYTVREPERTLTWVLPVWREQSPSLDRTWVVPFWFSETEQQAGGEETRTWTSILWPLYSREEVRSADGELLERRRRFAIFSDELGREGQRIFRLLGIVVSEHL